MTKTFRFCAVSFTEQQIKQIKLEFPEAILYEFKTSIHSANSGLPVFNPAMAYGKSLFVIDEKAWELMKDFPYATQRYF